MPNPTDVEYLADKQYLFMVVRLLMDKHRLVHGEVVDGTGLARRHFVEWDGLLPAIEEWLASEVLGPDAAP
ncbi:MAG: hypothetical protein M3220_16540 [Chloroflexota bacterium]|nr:hypothetical protein [Chloroflexota bacterium]